MTLAEKSSTTQKLRPKSAEAYAAACKVIPSGVNSPVRAFCGLEQAPLIVASGAGDEIVDLDGYTYIDFCGSWGALIHGHAHPLVVARAQKRLKDGSSFGISTQIETKLAQKVVSYLPAIEKIRFVSSGTEAAMSALRLARGCTKRDLVVKFSGHYHGHSDCFLVQAGSGLTTLSSTSSSAGVPHDVAKNTLCIPFNDFDAAASVLQRQNIAAVFVEPVVCNMGVVLPQSGFLQMLREETEKIGTLLIFDEVITGFRLGLGGAQGYYGITPDLSCFGKIIGGGMPAAAFGGRAALMDQLAPQGPVYQAGTLSGNPVAMEAGYQTLKLLEAPNFYQTLEAKTRLITEPVQRYIESRGLNACVQQIGSLFTLFFGKKQVANLQEAKECDLAQFAQFFTFLFERGIYFSPSQFEANFVSAAHSEKHLLYTRDCILEFFETCL